MNERYLGDFLILIVSTVEINLYFPMVSFEIIHACTRVYTEFNFTISSHQLGQFYWVSNHENVYLLEEFWFRNQFQSLSKGG